MARSAHFKQYSPCQVRNVRNGEVGVPYASLHFGDRTVPVTPHGTPVVGRQSPTGLSRSCPGGFSNAARVNISDMSQFHR